jgi:hypothetical protein
VGSHRRHRYRCASHRVGHGPEKGKCRDCASVEFVHTQFVDEHCAALVHGRRQTRSVARQREGGVLSLKVDIPYEGSHHNLVDRADVVQREVTAVLIILAACHGKHGSVKRQCHSGSERGLVWVWVRDVVVHAPLARAHTEIVHLHKALQ